MTIDERPNGPSYPLPRTDSERQRLVDQAAFYRPFTERLFRTAGLRPGMRVLDVGCGVGDVSFLAASLVGPSGSVVGIDRDAESVSVAGERATAAGLDTVEFRVGELAEAHHGGQFDALVGRLILCYLPDVAATLRTLCQCLVPPAVVCFHEPDFDLFVRQARPRAPLFERALGWVIDALTRSGVGMQTGSLLHASFRDAGLQPPTMQLDIPVITGAAPEAGLRTLADVVSSLLPVLERNRIVTRDQVGPDTLAERLIAEARELDTVGFAIPLMGAYCRVT